MVFPIWCARLKPLRPVFNDPIGEETASYDERVRVAMELDLKLKRAMGGE